MHVLSCPRTLEKYLDASTLLAQSHVHLSDQDKTATEKS